MNAPSQMPSTGDHPVIPFTRRPAAHIKLRASFPGATIQVSEQDRPAFAELRDSLFCSIRPKSGLEDELFRHLLNAAWQLRRFSQWEEELLSQPGNPFLNPETWDRLRLFQTHKNAQQRAFQLALAELRKIQTERLAITQTGELAQAQVTANSPLAAVTRIAKVSHLPLRVCIPAPHTLARNARTFFRPPPNLRRNSRPAASATG